MSDNGPFAMLGKDMSNNGPVAETGRGVSDNGIIAETGKGICLTTAFLLRLGRGCV